MTYGNFDNLSHARSWVEMYFGNSGKEAYGATAEAGAPRKKQKKSCVVIKKINGVSRTVALNAFICTTHLMYSAPIAGRTRK